MTLPESYFKKWPVLDDRERLRVAISFALISPECRSVHEVGYKKDFTYGVVTDDSNLHPNNPAYVEYTNHSSRETAARLVLNARKCSSLSAAASAISHEMVHLSLLNKAINPFSPYNIKWVLPENNIAMSFLEETVAYGLQSEFTTQMMCQYRTSLHDYKHAISQDILDYLSHKTGVSNDSILETGISDLFENNFSDICKSPQDHETRIKFVKNFMENPMNNTNKRPFQHYFYSFCFSQEQNQNAFLNTVQMRSIPKKWSFTTEEVSDYFSWNGNRFLEPEEWNEVFDGEKPVVYARKAIQNAKLDAFYNARIQPLAAKMGLPFFPI